MSVSPVQPPTPETDESLLLPPAFIERMKEQMGSDFDAFMKSYQRQDRYHGLHLNPLAISAFLPVQGETPPSGISHLSDSRPARHLPPADGRPARHPSSVKALLSSVISDLSNPIPWAKDAYYYGEEDRPGKHPYHEAGLYYIQEPSAMAPAVYLDARPGEYVLDLCAAPGGKSSQIAACMQGQGLLISNEIVPNRAAVLSENMERLGVVNAIVTNEDPDSLADHFPLFFDKIMVDAPCSGEGMFRKNAIALSEWSPENVLVCADRDDLILDAADRMLKEGGRLVFSTCTFAPTEDEGSIERFLDRHPNYQIERVPLYPGMTPADLEGTIRLWPHKLRGEGHYIAVLRKKTSDRALSAAGSSSLRTVSAKRESAVRGSDFNFLSRSLREIVKSETADWILGDGELLRFRDDFYRIPRGLPTLRGLKLTRAGLHLGTVKKNRFEPSHALSHALEPDQALRIANLSSGNVGQGSNERALFGADQIRQFIGDRKQKIPAVITDVPGFSARHWIAGETFRTEGDKGWYLITVDGIHLGWGKLAGGSMKNHYPKGLRRNL